VKAARCRRSCCCSTRGSNTSSCREAAVQTQAAARDDGSGPSSSHASTRRGMLGAFASVAMFGAVEQSMAAGVFEGMKPLSPEATKVARLYDSYAASYDVLDGGALASGLGYDELRNSLVGQAKGTILEVGVGTGLNLPYYNWDGVNSVTVSDVSLEMITIAARRANSDGKVIGQPIAFQPADVANLPFPDNTFDTVVDTFSLCVFPNPEKALKEMARVLKPGGRLLLLEHTRSENPVLGAYQDVTNPYVKKMSKECSWNQNVPQMVADLNLRPIKRERHLAGTIIAYTLSNPKPSPEKAV
jgi:methyltransferase OMS1